MFLCGVLVGLQYGTRNCRSCRIIRVITSSLLYMTAAYDCVGRCSLWSIDSSVRLLAVIWFYSNLNAAALLIHPFLFGYSKLLPYISFWYWSGASSLECFFPLSSRPLCHKSRSYFVIHVWILFHGFSRTSSANVSLTSLMSNANVSISLSSILRGLQTCRLLGPEKTSATSGFFDFRRSKWMWKQLVKSYVYNFNLKIVITWLLWLPMSSQRNVFVFTLLTLDLKGWGTRSKLFRLWTCPF